MFDLFLDISMELDLILGKLDLLYTLENLWLLQPQPQPQLRLDESNTKRRPNTSIYS